MTARDAFDTLTPDYHVQVNGQALPNDALADLIGLSVVEDVDAASMFTLTMPAWDTARMVPKWIDEPLFAPGAPVEIGFGYRDQTTTMMVGEITALEPTFMAATAPTLTVRGHDRRHRLMRSRRTRSFTECKDSDIASRIAAESGLAADVQDSNVRLPYVLQHNQTDLEFLGERARRMGWEVTVDDRSLRFRSRPTDRSPVLTLHREVELLEFRPRLSTLEQVSEIEVHGWNPQDKREIVARATVSDVARPMGSTSGPATVRSAFEPTPTSRVTQPVHSQEEADQLARLGMAEVALRHIRADGVCSGEPRLRAGIVVRIEGLGTRFSGLYYVTAVEHRFGRNKGYRTAFSARRNASS